MTTIVLLVDKNWLITVLTDEVNILGIFTNKTKTVKNAQLNNNHDSEMHIFSLMMKIVYC